MEQSTGSFNFPRAYSTFDPVDGWLPVAPYVCDNISDATAPVSTTVDALQYLNADTDTGQHPELYAD